MVANEAREDSASVKEQPKIQWNEPSWSYRPRIKSEMSTVLSAKMWVRVLAVVTVIVAGMAFSIKRAVPDLDFDWVRAVVLTVGSLAIYLFIFIGAHLLIPPQIRISPKGISRQHGQSVAWRAREDIQSITVDTSDPVCPRLLVEAMGKKPWEAGIAAKVNIPDVVNCLRENFSHALINVKK
jgi:hypothetical protein